jgi:excisionase family DNA binding protein
MAPTDSEAVQLMTAQDVSVLLNGVPVSTIHAWARTGFLPSVKLGKHRRFDREDVAAFLRELRGRRTR